jgi:hypothetical protein
MDTSGFYKQEGQEVFHGPYLVYNQNYMLAREEKDNLNYPIDGWYWFDSIEEAYTFFGLEYKEPIQNPHFEET